MSKNIEKAKLLIVMNSQDDISTNPLVSPVDANVVSVIKEEINKSGMVLFVNDSYNQDPIDELVDHCEHSCIPFLFFEDTNELSVDWKDFVENTVWDPEFTWTGSFDTSEDFWDHVSEVEFVGVAPYAYVAPSALSLKSVCPDMRISVCSSGCARTNKEFHDAATRVMKHYNINIID